jgi:hypothetical protein
MPSKKKSSRIDRAVFNTLRKEALHAEVNPSRPITIAQKVKILLLLNEGWIGRLERDRMVARMVFFTASQAEEQITKLNQTILERSTAVI